MFARSKGILGIAAAAMLFLCDDRFPDGKLRRFHPGWSGFYHCQYHLWEYGRGYLCSGGCVFCAGAALNEQINSMESRYPGYDEYRYQIDEISHNPVSPDFYFSAKYGEFTYEQVRMKWRKFFSASTALPRKAHGKL